MTSKTYDYSVFGLTVQSELALPELQPLTVSTSAAVHIRFAKINPAGLPNPIHQSFGYQASTTEFWLHIPSIARFLISNGDTILIQPDHSSEPDSLRTFLYTIGFKMLLQQCAYIVHAGYALVLNNKGVAFMDRGLTADSLLQTVFYKRGYSFLSDNFFAVNPNNELLPGPAQLEVDDTILLRLGLNKEYVQPLRPGIEKYRLPLLHQYQSSSVPLMMIYQLAFHKQNDIIFSEAAQTTSIYIPAAGLKLQQLADAIENNVAERSTLYADH